MNDTYAVTAEELISFIERVENLEAEKKASSDLIREVMKEAKGRGYDTKIMRKIIKIRKIPVDVIAEEEAVFELYKNAIGM